MILEKKSNTERSAMIEQVKPLARITAIVTIAAAVVIGVAIGIETPCAVAVIALTGAGAILITPAIAIEEGALLAAMVWEVGENLYEGLEHFLGLITYDVYDN